MTNRQPCQKPLKRTSGPEMWRAFPALTAAMAVLASGAFLGRPGDWEK